MESRKSSSGRSNTISVTSEKPGSNSNVDLRPARSWTAPAQRLVPEGDNLPLRRSTNYATTSAYAEAEQNALFTMENLDTLTSDIESSEGYESSASYSSVRAPTSGTWNPSQISNGHIQSASSPSVLHGMDGMHINSAQVHRTNSGGNPGISSPNFPGGYYYPGPSSHNNGIQIGGIGGDPGLLYSGDRHPQNQVMDILHPHLMNSKNSGSSNSNPNLAYSPSTSPIPTSPLGHHYAGGGGSFGEHPLGEHPSRTLFVRNINSNVDDEVYFITLFIPFYQIIEILFHIPSNNPRNYLPSLNSLARFVRCTLNANIEDL